MNTLTNVLRGVIAVVLLLFSIFCGVGALGNLLLGMRGIYAPQFKDSIGTNLFGAGLCALFAWLAFMGCAACYRASKTQASSATKTPK